jgi:hypothetical protein
VQDHSLHGAMCHCFTMSTTIREGKSQVHVDVKVFLVYCRIQLQRGKECAAFTHPHMVLMASSGNSPLIFHIAAFVVLFGFAPACVAVRACANFKFRKVGIIVNIRCAQAELYGLWWHAAQARLWCARRPFHNPRLVLLSAASSLKGQSISQPYACTEGELAHNAIASSPNISLGRGHMHSNC